MGIIALLKDIASLINREGSHPNKLFINDFRLFNYAKLNNFNSDQNETQNYL